MARFTNKAWDNINRLHKVEAIQARDKVKEKKQPIKGKTNCTDFACSLLMVLAATYFLTRILYTFFENL